MQVRFPLGPDDATRPRSRGDGETGSCAASSGLPVLNVGFVAIHDRPGMGGRRFILRSPTTRNDPAPLPSGGFGMASGVVTPAPALRPAQQQLLQRGLRCCGMPQKTVRIKGIYRRSVLPGASGSGESGVPDDGESTGSVAPPIHRPTGQVGGQKGLPDALSSSGFFEHSRRVCAPGRVDAVMRPKTVASSDLARLLRHQRTSHLPRLSGAFAVHIEQGLLGHRTDVAYAAALADSPPASRRRGRIRYASSELLARTSPNHGVLGGCAGSC